MSPRLWTRSSISWKGSGMTDKSYPPEMLRSIRKEEWISENPPYMSAFLFDKYVRNTDGYREMSVTWFYDKSSLSMIRSIIHDDECIFHGGLALIRKESVDAISQEYPGMLSYKMKPTSRNPHHGNILIRAAKTIDERMIAADIARSAVFYGINDDIPCSNGS